MKRAHGFTLVEMVSTVVVAIILVGFAIPSIRSMMANNRATTQANVLFSALNYARGEAIGRRATVTICPKATASVLDTNCGTFNDWANGWHAFVDDDSNGTYNGTDELLRHWEPLPGTPTLTTAEGYIAFRSDGSKESVAPGEVTVEMAETGTVGETRRCIRVADLGSIRVERLTGADTCP